MSTSRSSKRSLAVAQVETVSTPVPETASAPVPAKESKAKKQKVATVVEVVAPVPTPAPEPVVEMVAPVADTADEVSKPSLTKSFMDEKETLLTLCKAGKENYLATQACVKRIGAVADKIARANEKSSRRKKGKTDTQSGFKKLTLISDELAEFCGKEKGSEASRAEISKTIHNYLLANNLQGLLMDNGKTNRRFFKPDAKLQKLLEAPSDVKLSYFNVQRYLKPHFLKKDVPNTKA